MYLATLVSDFRDHWVAHLGSHSHRVDPETGKRLEEIRGNGDIGSCSSPADRSANANRSRVLCPSRLSAVSTQRHAQLRHVAQSSEAGKHSVGSKVCSFPYKLISFFSYISILPFVYVVIFTVVVLSAKATSANIIRIGQHICHWYGNSGCPIWNLRSSWTDPLRSSLLTSFQDSISQLRTAGKCQRYLSPWFLTRP